MLRRLRLAVATVALAAPLAGQSPVSVTGLMTDYRANPIGTDVLQPRLSWRIESARRNTMQAAYQIQVATSPEALLASRTLLWDSGRITTATAREGGMSLSAVAGVRSVRSDGNDVIVDVGSGRYVFSTATPAPSR